MALVEFRHLKHEGGTKDYTIFTVIDGPNHTAVNIFRWGKVGTAGQIKVDKAVDLAEARHARDKKIAGKRKRGYSLNNWLDARIRSDLVAIPEGKHRDALKDIDAFFANDLSWWGKTHPTSQPTPSMAPESFKTAEISDDWGSWA